MTNIYSPFEQRITVGFNPNLVEIPKSYNVGLETRIQIVRSNIEKLKLDTTKRHERITNRIEATYGYLLTQELLKSKEEIEEDLSRILYIREGVEKNRISYHSKTQGSQDGPGSKIMPQIKYLEKLMQDNSVSIKDKYSYFIHVIYEIY